MARALSLYAICAVTADANAVQRGQEFRSWRRTSGALMMAILNVWKSRGGVNEALELQSAGLGTPQNTSFLGMAK